MYIVYLNFLVLVSIFALFNSLSFSVLLLFQNVAIKILDYTQSCSISFNAYINAINKIIQVSHRQLCRKCLQSLKSSHHYTLLFIVYKYIISVCRSTLIYVYTYLFLHNISVLILGDLI